MQHLVGAKLSLLLGDEKVQRFGFSVADEVSGRGGDFVIGDIAMHVTTMPGEALMRKCKANLEAGIRPVIVTMFKHVPGANPWRKSRGSAAALTSGKRSSFWPRISMR